MILSPMYRGKVSYRFFELLRGLKYQMLAGIKKIRAPWQMKCGIVFCFFQC